MSEVPNGSGTVSRTRKQSDTLHPHYFNAFQNYCSGPKAKTTPSSSNKDDPPIPEVFKVRADAILNLINRMLIERITQITQFTSVLSNEFFQHDAASDFQKYLIDRTMFKTMTDAGVINWMTSLKKLHPVRTSGNGNCLLHAVLIAMVGAHDFDLHLRDQLRSFMSTNSAILKASWKVERVKTDKMYGIQSEEAKLDSEWEELCDLVRYENSEDGQTASNLEFLEAVHIFSVSNMLARPIIILSEDVVRNKHGEAISVNDLYGIYLPTLVQPQSCVKEPIVLAYDQSHFCPLQTNDYQTNAKSDNVLPLYQSAEHTRKQGLLPIRFLGNGTNVDDAHRLLYGYLNIKKLLFYPDTNSTGVPVVCAELGSRRFGNRDDFFLLYYDYLKEFFEAQKRKLKEEDEEEESRRRREQEYYHQSQPPPPEIPPRIAIKPEISSSPPPPYSQAVARTIETRKPIVSERRPSYGEAVTNGNSYGSIQDNNRSMNHYSEVSKPHHTAQLIHHHPTVTDNYPYTSKQHLPISNWDANHEETNHNGKIVGYNGVPSRGTDSRLKQEQQQKQRTTQIPVRIGKSDLPSANLIDFDQQTDRIRPCIVCKSYFEDRSSTGLCPTCDYKKNPPARQAAIRRPSPSGYSNSDFLSPHPAQTKFRGPVKIVCTHCRNMNLLHNPQYGLGYTCSICGTYLNVAQY